MHKSDDFSVYRGIYVYIIQGYPNTLNPTYGFPLYLFVYRDKGLGEIFWQIFLYIGLLLVCQRSYSIYGSYTIRSIYGRTYSTGSFMVLSLSLSYELFIVKPTIRCKN